MKNILHRENLKLLYFLAILLLTFFLIFYIDNLLLSFVLAFVVYYLLAPIVNLWERKGLSRSMAIAGLYVITTIVFVTLCLIFIPLLIDQATGLEDEFPKLRDGFTKLVQDIENRINSVFHLGQFGILNSLSDWLLDQTSMYSYRIPKWISDSLTTLFLTPFLAFFMLRDGSTFKRQVLQMVPNNFFEMTMNLIHEMNDQVGSFIRARIFEALIVGMVTYLGLAFINFPFAAILALFAAATNLIPYIGPIAGAVPAVIIVLVNSDIALGSMEMNVFAVSIVYLTAQLLDAFFIIPVVVAKIVNLHPVTVILVIILGAQVMGILGMIISIPAASLCKLFFTTLYAHTMRSGGPRAL